MITTTTSKQQGDGADGAHQMPPPSPSQPAASRSATSAEKARPSSSTSSFRPASNATPSINNHQLHQAGTSSSSGSSANNKPEQRKISSANLLDPNNANHQQARSVEQQRRKSTLSANGFFIDYSCTRRRSCAASHQQQARANPAAGDPLARSRFLRNVISPVRRPSAMIAGSMSGVGGGARESRASCSLAGSSGNQLLPPTTTSGRLRAPSLGGCTAARSMAGSRKTSIFDPTGHSLAAARRRSTMTPVGGGGAVAGCRGQSLLPAVEQAATMLAVSRQAAALQRAEHVGGKHELVERVPVIGCSPTSIRASLAALDETRRYKKLLHKLAKHQKRKEKERIKLIDDDDDELMVCDIDLDGEDEDDDEWSDGNLDCDTDGRRRRQHRRVNAGDEAADGSEPDLVGHVGANLRRKSLRAIKDVGQLLNKAVVMQKRRRRRKRRWLMSSNSTHRGDSFVDGLSISSTLSFVSSQTSSPSIERFLDELSLFQYGHQNQTAHQNHDDLSEDEAVSCFSEGNYDQVRYEQADNLNNEVDLDDDDDDDRGDPIGAVGSSSLSARATCASTRPASARTSTGPANQGNDFGRESNNNCQRAAKNINERTAKEEADQRRRWSGWHSDRERDECDEDRQGNQQQHPRLSGGEQALRDEARMSIMSQGRETNATNNNNIDNNSNGKSSLVRKAMKRIAATLGAVKRSPSSGQLAFDTVASRQQDERDTTLAPERERESDREKARRELYDTRPARGDRLNKQLEQNQDRRCAGEDASASRRRRRSVSMSAGLNYWHYYYYLRDNSADLADGGLGMPLARASHSAGGGGNDGGGNNSTDQSRRNLATIGGVDTTGATHMSDFDRRARLYINYSLARLEILNCQSDPVAQLAERLAKAKAKQSMLSGAGAQHRQGPSSSHQQQQQQHQSCEFTLDINATDAQPQSPAWDGLFDFSESTDVSLALSTSSSSVVSTGTSRNSSSLSSPAAATTTSGSSAATPSSSSPSSCLDLIAPTRSSRTSPKPDDKSQGQDQQHRGQYLGEKSNRPDSRVCARENPNMERASSSRSSLANHQHHHHHGQQQQQQQTGQPSHSQSSHSIHSTPSQGQAETRLDYVCQQQHSSCHIAQPPQQQQQQAHFPYANLQPGPDPSQQRRRSQNNSSPNGQPINDRSEMACGELDTVRQMRLRSISRSVGCMEQEEGAFDADQRQGHTTNITTTTTCQVFGPDAACEPQRDNNRDPTLPNRPIQRDAHFRFSVKAPSKQLIECGRRRERAGHHHGDHNDDHHYRQQQQQQPQRLQFSVSRRSRTSQSWDRLEITGSQPTDQHHDQHQQQHHLLVSSASSQSRAGRSDNGTPSRPELAAGRDRSEQTRLGAALANRRSFRMPKTAAQDGQPKASAASSASWASRSKSFLFHGRFSFRSTKQNKTSSGANDEQLPVAPGKDQAAIELKDRAGDDYARPTATGSRLNRTPSRRSSGRRQSPVAAGKQRPRDEQREAADKLLEQFEAQMSQAANLGREAELNSARGQQQAARRDYHQQQQQQPHEFQSSFHEATHQASGSGVSASHNNSNNNNGHQRQLSPASHQFGLGTRLSRSSASSTQSIDSHHSRASTSNQTQPGRTRDTALGADQLLADASEATSAMLAKSHPGSVTNLSGPANHDEQQQQQQPICANQCYCCQPRPQLQVNRAHHNQQQHYQGRDQLSLAASQQFGAGHQASTANQLYRNSTAALVAAADGRGQSSLNSIEQAGAHYSASAQAIGSGGQPSWQQQATQAGRHHQQVASHQQHLDDNNNSNLSCATTNESSPFDGCVAPMQQQQHQQHQHQRQSSSSNEDALNQTNTSASNLMRPYEFNYQQQQQPPPPPPPAGSIQMSSVPNGNCHPTNNGLTLRARAHSTSASTERYAYARPTNLQSNQHQLQISSQQLYHHHQHRNAQISDDHRLTQIGQTQTGANSMVALSSSSPHQINNDTTGPPSQAGLADSAPLRLQLTPRLLASDSAGYFIGQQQHQQHNDLVERVCQSVRPSTVHLVEALARDERPDRVVVVGESAHQMDERTRNRGSRQELDQELRSNSPGHLQHQSGQQAQSHQSGFRPGTGMSTSTTSKRCRSSARTSTSRGPQTFTKDTTIDRTATTTTGACSDNLSSQALSLLRKNTFNCTILGARQTGKRSIVICFVKLLNEFKLASDEFKRETMITKLVECSEKLQELASKREQQLEDEEEEEYRRQQRRTSRLNSWLPSGGTVKSLLNLSPVSKKRLHSVAGPLLNVGTRKQSDAKQHHGAGGVQVRPEALRDQRHQRRHTAIEPPSFRHTGGSSGRELRLSQAALDETSNADRTTTTAARLVNKSSQRSSMLSVQLNKSDTNINYQTIPGSSGRHDESDCLGNVSASEPTRPPSSSYQLQVPTWEDSINYRKQSEPSDTNVEQPNDTQASPTMAMPRQERRHTTNVSSVGFLRSQDGPALESQLSGRNRPRCSLSPSTAATIAGRARPRRQSICMSRRRRRILLSLKELNRRKFAIKFNTRRQISASLIDQMREADQMRAANRGRAGRRRSTILQLTGGLTGSARSAQGCAPLPDAFLVVYSINDRDSFDYARSMIEQLRSISALLQQDVPLPIMLVANKSDLERNREVKIDDGRAVAKKYSCKFIEISCTIGFNLDNLLVGLRTQLVLKHHIVLNSILRPDFRHPTTKKATDDNNNKNSEGGPKTSKDESPAKDSSGNILIRFYKRYVMDNHENEYDCDNFSKL